MKSIWLRFIPKSFSQRFEGRAQIRTILGNISWLSLDRIIRMGVGLVVGVWLARYLGPEQLGTLNFAIAFVALFSPIAMLGLDSIVVRDFVRFPGEKGLTLGTAFLLKLVGAVCSGALAIGVILLTRPGEQLTHLLVAITAVGVLFQSVDVIDLWFQSQLQAKFVVFARNIAFLTLAACKIAFLLLGAPLVYFAIAASAELIMGALGLIVFYHRAGEHIREWAMSAKRGISLLGDSWPLFLSGISIAIYMRIDQVMIGYMLNEASVGTYSVAIRLVEIWYFLPTAIASSVLPALMKARKDNELLYRARLQVFYNLMSMTAIGFAAVISIFAPFIINILYGQKFAAASPVLAVYAWATIPVFLGVASSQHFIVENRTKVLMYRTFAGVVTNVLLNLVLIPAYGLVGAAVASLVSQTAVVFSIVMFSGSGQAVMLLSSLNPLNSLRYLRRN